MVTTFCVFYVSCFLPPPHQGEEEVEMSSIELLYQGILPSLPQYMVSAVWCQVYIVVLWIISYDLKYNSLDTAFIIYTFRWFTWINVS